jgi:hypothetical protein
MIVEVLTEVLAFNPFFNDDRMSVGGSADADDADNARVLEFIEEIDFAFEAGEAIGKVVGRFRAIAEADFEGSKLPGLTESSTVHGALAASVVFPEQREFRELVGV